MIANTHNFKLQTKIKTTVDWRIFALPVTLALMALQFLPYLLLWDKAYIRIHDTLEGIDYQVLFNAGKTFDYSPGATLEQVLGGQLRAAFKTGWSFVALWQWLFGLYGGYIFNYVLVHLAAFGGMFLLLRQYFFYEKQDLPVLLGVALCFAWLPFFNNLGISVAGLPLVAWAFLNILKKERVAISWLVFTLFPFYSDIVWAGIPLLLTGGLYFLYFLIKTKRWHWLFASALGWMAALYLAVNWQLFQITLWPGDFISHRTEYDYFYNKNLTLEGSLSQAVQVFFSSHHHVGIFISLPVLLAASWSARWFGWQRRELRILITIVCLSLFYGFYNWLVWLAGDHFELLKTLKFERMIVLLPVLWMILFASSLLRLNRRRIFQRSVAWLLAGQLLIGLVANDEFFHNLHQLAGHPRKPNFQAFFDRKLFAAIDRHIGLPKDSYRVVSLGMHPSVAQFNGFYTLDCHASVYNLVYKHQFRKIMEQELDKSEIIRKEFDYFGNRCYLFSAELGKEYDAFTCGKAEGRQVKNLQIQAEAICELGGCYLFSAVEILNPAENSLQLSGTFEGKYWRVQVYQVMDQRIRKVLTKN